MASVRSLTIFLFCVSLNTPSMSFTLMRGMVISLCFWVGSGGDIVERGRKRNNRNAAILDRDAGLKRARVKAAQSTPPALRTFSRTLTFGSRGTGPFTGCRRAVNGDRAIGRRKHSAGKAKHALKRREGVIPRSMEFVRNILRRPFRPLMQTLRRRAPKDGSNVLNLIARLKRLGLTDTTFIAFTGSCGKSMAIALSEAILSSVGNAAKESIEAPHSQPIRCSGLTHRRRIACSRPTPAFPAAWANRYGRSNRKSVW
jgi:hypothetical protein